MHVEVRNKSVSNKNHGVSLSFPSLICERNTSQHFFRCRKECEVVVFLDFPDFILVFVLQAHLTSELSMVLITSLRFEGDPEGALSSKFKKFLSPLILCPLPHYFFLLNFFSLGLKFA